ncbi:MAG: PilZ domain-containing protein [Terriglobia bacterium]
MVSSARPEERREQRRVGLNIPILLEWRADGGHIRRARGVTRDISRRGVYCFLEEPLPNGQCVEFDIVFPGELTAAEPLALHCRGTAVRSEVQERRFGLAASIEVHEPLRAAAPGAETERRVRPRIKPESALVVEYPGLQTLIRDISTTGAFIEDERPLPVGRVIDLGLRRTSSHPPIELRAVVRRVEPQVGMAVEFIALSEEAEAQLREIVAEKNLHPLEAVLPTNPARGRRSEG